MQYWCNFHDEYLEISQWTVEFVIVVIAIRVPFYGPYKKGDMEIQTVSLLNHTLDALFFTV